LEEEPDWVMYVSKTKLGPFAMDKSRIRKAGGESSNKTSVAGTSRGRNNEEIERAMHWGDGDKQDDSDDEESTSSETSDEAQTPGLKGKEKARPGGGNRSRKDLAKRSNKHA
jgi:hypothetical protein